METNRSIMDLRLTRPGLNIECTLQPSMCGTKPKITMTGSAENVDSLASGILEALDKLHKLEG